MAHRLRQVAVKLDQTDLETLDRLVGYIPAGRDARGHERRNRSEAIRRLINRVPARILGDDDAACIVVDTTEAGALAELALRFGTTIDYVVIALLNDPNHRAVVKRELAAMARESNHATL